MERLLHWAVENSDPQGLEASRQNMQKLDPEIIDMILGKDDPTRMKECIDIIKDKSGKFGEEERLAAFDELEMIVEGIDNASNMERMNLWPQIFSCISPNESIEVVRFALWIVGTCAQNNPETQKDLLEKHQIFEILLNFWQENSATHVTTMDSTSAADSTKDSTHSTQTHNTHSTQSNSNQDNGDQNAAIHPSHMVQSKIIYCLSALLSNNPQGLQDFITRNGFKIINNFVTNDPEIVRKIGFLLGKILANEIGHDTLRCLIENCDNLLNIFDNPQEE